jgi:hypothetical protein
LLAALEACEPSIDGKPASARAWLELMQGNKAFLAAGHRVRSFFFFLFFYKEKNYFSNVFF